MEIRKETMQERIYTLLCGQNDLRQYSAPEANIVKSAFMPGSLCDRAYEDMLRAYSRLCLRLDSPQWSDPDVECIIHNLRAIGKELSFQMYRYGMIFSQME